MEMSKLNYSSTVLVGLFGDNYKKFPPQTRQDYRVMIKKK